MFNVSHNPSPLKHRSLRPENHFPKYPQLAQDHASSSHGHGKERLDTNLSNYDNGLTMLLRKIHHPSKNSQLTRVFDKSGNPFQEGPSIFHPRSPNLSFSDLKYANIDEILRPKNSHSHNRTKTQYSNEPEQRMRTSNHFTGGLNWVQGTRDISFVPFLIEKSMKRSKSPLPLSEPSSRKRTSRTKSSSEDTENSVFPPSAVRKRTNSIQYSFAKPSAGRLGLHASPQPTDKFNPKRIPVEIPSNKSKNPTPVRGNRKLFCDENLIYGPKNSSPAIGNSSAVFGGERERYARAKGVASDSKKVIHTEEGRRQHTSSPEIMGKTTFYASVTPEPNGFGIPEQPITEAINNSLLIKKTYL